MLEKNNYMAFNKWACLKVFLEDMTTRGKLERIDGRAKCSSLGVMSKNNDKVE